MTLPESPVLAVLYPRLGRAVRRCGAGVRASTVGLTVWLSAWRSAWRLAGLLALALGLLPGCAVLAPPPANPALLQDALFNHPARPSSGHKTGKTGEIITASWGDAIKPSAYARPTRGRMAMPALGCSAPAATPT